MVMNEINVLEDSYKIWLDMYSCSLYAFLVNIRVTSFTVYWGDVWFEGNRGDEMRKMKGKGEERERRK